MNSLSEKKAFHTSLIISPPVSLWGQIQEIRKFYDTAYLRWMPHINMTFPFVVEQDFDTACSLLQDALKDFSAFPVELKTLGYFTKEKDCVLWVDPDVKNDELSKLEDIIVKTIPFCDDLTKLSKGEGFKPHMTLGRFEEKIIEKKLKENQEKWKTLSFMVNELYVIFRKDSESPFFILKTIKLKNMEETHSEMDNINKEMENFDRGFYQTNCF